MGYAGNYREYFTQRQRETPMEICEFAHGYGRRRRSGDTRVFFAGGNLTPASSPIDDTGEKEELETSADALEGKGEKEQ